MTKEDLLELIKDYPDDAVIVHSVPNVGSVELVHAEFLDDSKKLPQHVPFWYYDKKHKKHKKPHISLT